MIYKLKFLPSALKEWKKLGATLKNQFKKKLEQRLIAPKVVKDQLYGWTDVYKIKLRSSGYRLVYEVNDKEIVVTVLAVGKRERKEVYTNASNRKQRN